MLRKFLPVLAGLLGLATLASGAAAADFFAFGHEDEDSIGIWKPYVIEKNCTEHFDRCEVRMDYAPFERAMVVKPGNYWYQKPFKIHRYGDFEHHDRHASQHVAWCSARYRTYDPASDTFIGKGYRHYRCNSPYAGR